MPDDNSKLENVRYFFLRDRNKFPVACVASVRGQRDGRDWLNFAVATHNPKDEFNKTIAKNIATNRLFTEGRDCNDGFAVTCTHLRYQLVSNLYDGAARGFHYPVRTLEAAELWLQNFAAHHTVKGDEGI